ncbi:MAG TPA: BadF/BadG/BcrA/BcrD ATPase family protein [Streptosporangiaceae bacterium]|jgi:N-acetylglucosamine kinase-like BadF-type ATPase|nr:BadF/BadG/BcrA/BcrD ATPase family protein [Streptosporangiaceae bacterium]
MSVGRPLYGIDAGGTGTSVRAWNGDHWTGPSVNPSSVGQDASDRCLADLFTRIRDHAAANHATANPATENPATENPATARPAVWLASASVDPALVDGEARRCAEAARVAGLRAELVISNDLTPLVLDAPPGTGHVIVVCGTGSGFLATDGRSAPVRVGGCEYLGSDEGSAFDLGLFGLRAAVRGLDGRGARTALSDLLAAQAGAPVPELARRLARDPFPKAAVAALAPAVLRAWLGGDQVADGLVTDAIAELAVGARAARDAAGVGSGWRLSAIGGIVTGCPPFFARLAAAAAGLGADPVTLISDPAAAMLTALARLAATDPMTLSDPRIDRDSRYLDLTAQEPAQERLASGQHA